MSIGWTFKWFSVWDKQNWIMFPKSYRWADKLGNQSTRIDWLNFQFTIRTSRS